MKIEQLEKKYGKALIKRILEGNYLNGCTAGINPDGSEDQENLVFTTSWFSG